MGKPVKLKLRPPAALDWCENPSLRAYVAGVEKAFNDEFERRRPELERAYQHLVLFGVAYVRR